MKRLLVTLLAATGLSSAAFASDLPYGSNNNYYAPAQSFTWAGFYAGLNAGYGWNTSDDNKINDHFGTLSYGGSKKSDGFTGGLQIGYNFQSGSIVYGLEADLNMANLRRRDSGFGNYTGKAETYSVSSKTSWFGTIRPRLGFAVTDRFLVFATGGLAYGKVKLNSEYQTGFYQLGGNNDDMRWGWTLGAGVEYAITNNLTIKGEYAYIDLSDKSHTWQGRTNFNAMTVKDSPSFQVLRAGVNYKF
ncbi:outer membrane protein [Microvirga sp. W0021]|uniref:Outer membrane protein n=1 Tax=Hohaiivirga grylli TaxID=3133970 RepID=A0ABV0BMR3_9HYPH